MWPPALVGGSTPLARRIEWSALLSKKKKKKKWPPTLVGGTTPSARRIEYFPPLPPFYKEKRADCLRTIFLGSSSMVSRNQLGNYRGLTIQRPSGWNEDSPPALTIGLISGFLPMDLKLSIHLTMKPKVGVPTRIKCQRVQWWHSTAGTDSRTIPEKSIHHHHATKQDQTRALEALRNRRWAHTCGPTCGRRMSNGATWLLWRVTSGKESLEEVYPAHSSKRLDRHWRVGGLCYDTAGCSMYLVRLQSQMTSQWRILIPSRTLSSPSTAIGIRWSQPRVTWYWPPIAVHLATHSRISMTYRALLTRRRCSHDSSCALLERFPARSQFATLEQY